MTGDARSVDLSVVNRVATVTFRDPKANSLPGATLLLLADTILKAGQESDADVIVLQSDGHKAFCAGASFDELLAVNSETAGTEFFMGFAHVLLALRKCGKIVIARVHGSIIGGGVGVVAACDIRLGVSEMKVCLSERKLGIGPFVIGPAVQRRVGLTTFEHMALSCETFDSDWARSVGLLSEVVDPANLDSRVAEVAAELVRTGPGNLALLKQVFWEGTDDWETLLPARAAMSGGLVVTDKAQALIRATKKK